MVDSGVSMSGSKHDSNQVPMSGGHSASASSRVSVAAVESIRRFSLRMRAETAGRAIGPGGLRFDLPINRCVVAGSDALCRLGPDEWLVLTPAAEGERLHSQLQNALAPHFHSLVDISQRHLGFSVEGSRAADVINGGCPLDLGESAFPAGSATRTVLGRAEIVLLRPTAELSYHVECGRSFAPYVHEFLRESARDFLQT